MSPASVTSAHRKPTGQYLTHQLSASGTLVSHQNGQSKAETQLEMDEHNVTTLPRTQSPVPVEDDDKMGCTDPDSNILKKEDYDAFAQRFTIIVATSTFTATAIITVLALARDVVNEIYIEIEISMFLGFLAAATHFFAIVMASRAATLAFRTAREPHHKDAFKHYMSYFNICEQLHLTATILFITCVLVAIHSVFVHKQFVYALYVYAAIGMSLIFFFTPFWKDSVLVWDLLALYNRFDRKGASRRRHSTFVQHIGATRPASAQSPHV